MPTDDENAYKWVTYSTDTTKEVDWKEFYKLVEETKKNNAADTLAKLMEADTLAKLINMPEKTKKDETIQMPEKKEPEPPDQDRFFVDMDSEL